MLGLIDNFRRYLGAYYNNVHAFFSAVFTSSLNYYKGYYSRNRVDVLYEIQRVKKWVFYMYYSWDQHLFCLPKHGRVQWLMVTCTLGERADGWKIACNATSVSIEQFVIYQDIIIPVPRVDLFVWIRNSRLRFSGVIVIYRPPPYWYYSENVLNII